MKLHNIAIAGLSALVLGACSDYLDVDAPSKKQLDEAYASTSEVETALNGVYAQLLSSDTYGEKLLTIYSLNSDVDFAIQNGHYAAVNTYRRYECDPDAGDLYKSWSQFYAAIEAANIFIDQLENSDLMSDYKTAAEMKQKLGEAKVIRAMNYHDLIWMFGDVPMSFVPSYNAETMIYPVTDRAEIIDSLIADLEEIAPEMKSAADLDCDRISQEMAWAMIARLSLAAAGYTLRPEGNSYGKMELMNPGKSDDYYAICRDNCAKVISSGSFDISTQDYYEVFTNECNGILAKGGDVIFEIPFGKESSGSIGYVHGPKMDADNGETPHAYGAASAGAQLNAFYRFFFDEDDMRRDYINQLWYYPTSNKATFIYSNNRGRTIYNGKWSKLWVNGGLGARTTGSTGINYPYMRYTDVLLMYAEAVNELEHGVGGANGANAVEALRQVRARAFRATNPSKVDAYIAEVSSGEDTFRKAVLDERKFEFAGENMRWRDLVRHNMLAENTFWNFWRYYAVAENAQGTSLEIEPVAIHDFGNPDHYNSDNFPYWTYYTNDTSFSLDSWAFPNRSVKGVDIKLNSAYEYLSPSEKPANVSENSLFEWYDSDKGCPQDYFCYSLRGYIYCDYEITGNVYINNNGVYTTANTDPTNFNAANLPVVRYILPYPRNVIARSNGVYTNKYGY